MSEHRKMPRRGRAKLALTLLAVCSCLGGAGLALAQVMRSPASGEEAPPPHLGAATTVMARSLSLSAVAPATRSVEPGATADFILRIRHRDRRRVRLSVLSGLPPGAVATFSPSPTRGKVSTLTIETAGSPAGSYRIRLLARSARRTSIAAVNLLISSPQGPDTPQGTNFEISGDLPGALEPGSSLPLNLALTNPGADEITITGLTVSVDSVSPPLASETYPCTLDDFSVSQFSGAYGFTVAAGTTATLEQLGVPDEQLPQVAMLNRPINQNGCKGASLRFSFTGTGGAP